MCIYIFMMFSLCSYVPDIIFSSQNNRTSVIHYNDLAFLISSTAEGESNIYKLTLILYPQTFRLRVHEISPSPRNSESLK